MAPLTRTTDPADWPAYLGKTDLSTVFGFSERTVERRLADGSFGPWTQIGQRRYVSKTTLLRALERNSVDPAPIKPIERRRSRRRRNPRGGVL